MRRIPQGPRARRRVRCTRCGELHQRVVDTCSKCEPLPWSCVDCGAAVKVQAKRCAPCKKDWKNADTKRRRRALAKSRGGPGIVRVEVEAKSSSDAARKRRARELAEEVERLYVRDKLGVHSIACRLGIRASHVREILISRKVAEACGREFGGEADPWGGRYAHVTDGRSG